MTATPINWQEKALFLERVAGKRTKKGYNKKEADRILVVLQSIVDKEAILEGYFCQSVGILSPFRAQVDYLQQRIFKEFSVDVLERHRVLIGTPQTFQGEERDVMLITLAVDDQVHSATLRYLERADVFNVSITRARAVQYIFTSLNDPVPGNNSLLSAYFRHIESPALGQALKRRPRPSGDLFLQEVRTWLDTLNLSEIYEHYPIAGLDIDLVIVKEGSTYCIDLIGFPGPMAGALPAQHWKILGRIGIMAFALPYSRWHLQRAATQQAILKFLNLLPDEKKQSEEYV